MIQTQRLTIIPFHRRFITSRYINWLNDPDVTRFSNQSSQIHTKDSCIDYLDSHHNSGNMFWAIIEVREGYGHIGNINAIVDKKFQVADLGILIGEKQLWGKGYGLEAWLLAVDYVFSNTSVSKITGGTPLNNKAMISIFRKAGMREQTPAIVQDMVAGELIDCIVFELTR
jgi:ribosomal-protein-alanine N-acetyltransferase